MRNQNSIFTTLGASNHALEEREQHDYYATDPKAVELLLELEPFAPVIWEPACGEGHISKVLQAHGYEVISTDLIYRGFGDPEPLDFLKETLDDFEGDIITNPPYSMGLEFVQRALESVRPGGKVAMFLKVQFLECDNQEDIDRYSENDCQFSYDEENEVYTAVLKNADGDTLEVEGDECDFKGMAVAIEIAGTAVEHR